MTQPLCLRHVSHAYAGRPILADIDLSLAAAETIALIGASGIGKSTLLALAAGLLSPSSGHIERSFVRPGFMFQDAALLPWRTARANVAFALKATQRDRHARSAAASAALDRVGLTGADQDKYPRALSGGMRRRVAFARALVIAPDILLLDEPFSALDSGRARHLQTLLRAEIAARAIPTLIATHDLDEAIRLADRIVVLAGAPARIVAEHSVAHADDDVTVAAERAHFLARPEVAAALALP